MFNRLLFLLWMTLVVRNISLLCIVTLGVSLGVGVDSALAQTTTSSLGQAINTPFSDTDVSTDNIAISKLNSSATPVGDYVVGPGRIEVTVKPGESLTQMITVSNRMSDTRTFNLSVEDMSGSVDGSESVVLLGDKMGPYSLKDYISFPVDSLNLNLNERAQIPVTITMPPNAEPGGYYGAVLVSTLQNNTSGSNLNAPRSPVIARIGTLFFITVPGDINTSGMVTDFATKNHQHWFTSGPIDLNIAFQNTGSKHLSPYGEIDVTNMLGEQVGFVTMDPWFVLPKSLRLREITWNRSLLLGRYTVMAKINRGYDNIVDEKLIHIWVLPWKFLAGTFVAVVTVFLFVRFLLRTFEFRRRKR